MNLERRKFIRQTGSLMTGAAIFPLAQKLGMGYDLFETEEAFRTKKYGIQLWTVKDVVEADPKGVLQKLALYGYKQIESYESSTGIYFGIPHLEFKQYMNQLGLEIVSSHCNYKENMERKAAEAAEVGIKYLICPYLGAQKSLDDYKRFADSFNKAGEICKKAGIKFAYHNHAYSFKLQDGQYPQDIMMMNTDPELVDYEMDIYWVVTAGQNPIEWLRKYKGRFKLSHIKDRIKGAAEESASCNLGDGSISFKEILKVAKKCKMEYFLVEQERFDKNPSIKAAELNVKYLTKLKF